MKCTFCMIKVTKFPQPLLLSNDNVSEIIVSQSLPTTADKNNFKIPPPPPILRLAQKHSVSEYLTHVLQTRLDR